MKKLLFIIPIIFLYACSSTSPTNVNTSDAQKVTAVEYGIIKSASPIKIKGESNWIGATAGGMIGGLLGTQVCGEEEIIGTNVKILLLFTVLLEEQLLEQLHKVY